MNKISRNKNKWITKSIALFSLGFLFSICVGIGSATIDVTDIEEGDGIWTTLDVESPGMVGVTAWTNGNGHDDITLYLYDPTHLVASASGSDDQVSIDDMTLPAGTYTVKAYLTEAYGGGTRTISITSNQPLSLLPKYRKSVFGVEEGEAIWHDLSVDEEGWVFVNAWTNGNDNDEIILSLYDQTHLVASSSGYRDQVSITYLAPFAGMHTVKVYLNNAHDGGTRTVSVSSKYPLGSIPASVSIITDKNKYSPGDTMAITLNIDNPTANTVTFDWYIEVPQSNKSILYKKGSIAPGYSNTHTIPIPVYNLGPSPFGLVHYVHLLDSGSGEVLAQDSVVVAYSPGGAETSEVDIAETIKNSREKVELF